MGDQQDVLQLRVAGDVARAMGAGQFAPYQILGASPLQPTAEGRVRGDALIAALSEVSHAP